MSLPVLVLRADGTNCERETVHGFRMAGARVSLFHVREVARGTARLSDYGMLVIPGGFSYGDDISAGRVMAAELVFRLKENFFSFMAAGKTVIGICNGFQVLVKAGVLPFSTKKARQCATLAPNISGRFEDRWVSVVVGGSSSLLDGVRGRLLTLPVAHGEGRFLARDREVSRKLDSGGQVALRYADLPGYPTMSFPANPNGSPGGIAAVTNRQGNVLGMMPHPERFLYSWNHPAWTRREEGCADGLDLIRSFIRGAAS